MKKTILLFAVIAIFLPGKFLGQTQKGFMMLGSSSYLSGGFLVSIGSLVQPTNNATFGFGVSKTKFGSETFKSTYTVFNVNPNYSYFVRNNLMIGASLGYLRFRSKDEGDDESYGGSITSFSPSIRYYFEDSKKAKPYGQARAGWLRFSGEDDVVSANMLGLQFGLSNFINPHVALDFFADWSYFIISEEDTTDSLFGIGVGFGYFFHKQNGD